MKRLRKPNQLPNQWVTGTMIQMTVPKYDSSSCIFFFKWNIFHCYISKIIFLCSHCEFHGIQTVDRGQKGKGTEKGGWDDSAVFFLVTTIWIHKYFTNVVFRLVHFTATLIQLVSLYFRNLCIENVQYSENGTSEMFTCWKDFYYIVFFNCKTVWHSSCASV